MCKDVYRGAEMEKGTPVKLCKYECIFCHNIVEREESDEENCTPAICNAFAWRLVAERGHLSRLAKAESL
jgi:hypothetical protein